LTTVFYDITTLEGRQGLLAEVRYAREKLAKLRAERDELVRSANTLLELRREEDINPAPLNVLPPRYAEMEADCIVRVQEVNRRMLELIDSITRYALGLPVEEEDLTGA
jgi:CRP-like cAMP-binding protein